jgi:hypothetical protein
LDAAAAQALRGRGEPLGTQDGGAEDNHAGAVSWALLCYYPQLVTLVSDSTMRSMLRHLQLMNVDGLTRENVASHLQKYRLYIQRLQGSGGSTRSGSKQDSMMDFEDGDDAVEADAGDAEDIG